MKKVIIQAAVSVCLFLVVLFGFSKIDWISVFNIDAASTEEKLGELYWEVYSQTEEIVDSDSVSATLDSLLIRICRTNGIDRKKIKIHLFRNEEVNAFAFPNNHLVVYSGLIAECKNESELCGVLAHEIAHMQKGHVMRKLIKEVGLSVLVGVTSGGDGTQVLKETAKLLSSTAYDRSLESEADETAVTYLAKSGINPDGLADFLSRLANDQENIPAIAVWISTHPDSRQRSEQIIDLSGKYQIEYKPVLTERQWEALKTNALSNKSR